MFQHTAARRRLAALITEHFGVSHVSTHSRPKAAGITLWVDMPPVDVSTHSRPKAAGMEVLMVSAKFNVSTHSRPKAAGIVWANSAPVV